MDLTVVTSTLPERADMLNELRACIDSQTFPPSDWLIHVDEHREGPAVCLNRLVEQAQTEWVFRCDDDDLFDPNHFETLAPRLTDDADFVYTWPRVIPEGWIGEQGLQCVHPPKTLRALNWIASAAAVRRSFWLGLGGLRDVHNEDHDFIIRALDDGCRFRCVPEVTWTYRLGDWEHRSQGVL